MVFRDTNLITKEIDPPRNLGSGPKIFERLGRDLDTIFEQLKFHSDDITVAEGGGDPFGVGNEFQHFWLMIQNNGGTLQHQFMAPQSDINVTEPDSSLISAINSPASTDTNIPTGTDSSTAFVGGAKIGEAGVDQHMVYLDTADLTIGTFGVEASLLRTNIATSVDQVIISPEAVSRNVNGVTRTRLHLRLKVTQNDVSVPINTTNFTNTEFILVDVVGWMPAFS